MADQKYIDIDLKTLKEISFKINRIEWNETNYSSYTAGTVEYEADFNDKKLTLNFDWQAEKAKYEDLTEDFKIDVLGPNFDANFIIIDNDSNEMMFYIEDLVEFLKESTGYFEDFRTAAHTILPKNTLLDVAEGILDDAARESRDENLSSIEAVNQYAIGGLDEYLSDEEATLVRDCCLEWLEKGRNQNDYFFMITDKLR